MWTIENEDEREPENEEESEDDYEHIKRENSVKNGENMYN
jgi:hypothetical protein